MPGYRRGCVIACGWGAHCGGSDFDKAAEALCSCLSHAHRLERSVVLRRDEATRPAILRAIEQFPEPDDELVVVMLSLPRAEGGNLRTAPCRDDRDLISGADLQRVEAALAKRLAARNVDGDPHHHLLYVWDPNPPTNLLEVHQPTNEPDSVNPDPGRHVGTYCVMSVACPYRLPAATKPLEAGHSARAKVHFTDVSRGPVGDPAPFTFTHALARTLRAADTYAAGDCVALSALYSRTVEQLVLSDTDPSPPPDAGDPVGEHYGGCGEVVRPDHFHGAPPAPARLSVVNGDDPFACTTVMEPQEDLQPPAAAAFAGPKRRNSARKRRMDVVSRHVTVVFCRPPLLRVAATCMDSRRLAEARRAAAVVAATTAGAGAGWWRSKFGPASWVRFSVWMQAVEAEVTASKPGPTSPLAQLQGSRRVSIVAAVEAVVAAVDPPLQPARTESDFADEGLYPRGDKAVAARGGRRRGAQQKSQQGDGEQRSTLQAVTQAAYSRVYFLRASALAKRAGVDAPNSALLAAIVADPIDFRAPPVGDSKQVPHTPAASGQGGTTPMEVSLESDDGLSDSARRPVSPSPSTVGTRGSGQTHREQQQQQQQQQTPQMQPQQLTPTSEAAMIRRLSLLSFLAQVHSESQERIRVVGAAGSPPPEEDDEESLWQEKIRPFELSGLPWLSMLNRHLSRIDPSLPPAIPPTVASIGLRRLPVLLDPRSNPFATGPPRMSAAERRVLPAHDHLRRCGVLTARQLVELPTAVLLPMLADFPQQARELVEWRGLRCSSVCRPLVFEYVRLGPTITESIAALLRELDPLLRDKRYVSTHRLSETPWDDPGSIAVCGRRALLHLSAGETMKSAGVILKNGTSGAYVSRLVMGSRAALCGVTTRMELGTVNGYGVASVEEAEQRVAQAPLGCTVAFEHGSDMPCLSSNTELTRGDRHRVLWDVVLHRFGHELPSRRALAIGRAVCLLRRARQIDDVHSGRAGCYGWPLTSDLVHWTAIGGLARAPSLGSFDAVALPNFPVREYLQCRDEIRGEVASPATVSTSTMSSGWNMSSLWQMAGATSVVKPPSVTELLRKRVRGLPIPDRTPARSKRQREEERRQLELKQADYLERHSEFERRYFERMLRLIALREAGRFPYVENITEEERALQRENEAKKKAEQQLLAQWEINPDDIRDRVRDYLLERVKGDEEVRDLRPMPPQVHSLGYDEGAITIHDPSSPLVGRTCADDASFDATIVGNRCSVRFRGTFTNPLAPGAPQCRTLVVAVPDPLRRHLTSARLSAHSPAFAAKEVTTRVVPGHVARSLGSDKFCATHTEIPLGELGEAARIEVELEWVEQLHWESQRWSHVLYLPTVLPILLCELEADVCSVAVRKALSVTVKVATVTGVFDCSCPTHPMVPTDVDTDGAGVVTYTPADGPLWSNRPLVFLVRYPAGPCADRPPRPLPIVTAMVRRVSRSACRQRPAVECPLSPHASGEGYCFRRGLSERDDVDIAGAMSDPAKREAQPHRWLCYILLVPPAGMTPPAPLPGAALRRLLIVVDTTAALGAKATHVPPLAGVVTALRAALERAGHDRSVLPHVSDLRIVATAVPHPTHRTRPWVTWSAPAPFTAERLTAARDWLKGLKAVAGALPCNDLWGDLIDEAPTTLILLTATPPSPELRSVLLRRRATCSFNCLSIGPQSDPGQHTALANATGGVCVESQRSGKQLTDTQELLTATLPPPLLQNVSVFVPPTHKVEWEAADPAPPLSSQTPLALLCEITSFEQDSPPDCVSVKAAYPDAVLFEEVVPLVPAEQGDVAGADLRKLTQTMREPTVIRLIRDVANSGETSACALSRRRWCVRAVADGDADLQHDADPRVWFPAGGARGGSAAVAYLSALQRELGLADGCLVACGAEWCESTRTLRVEVRTAAVDADDQNRCGRLLLGDPRLVGGWTAAVDTPVAPLTSPATLSEIADEVCASGVACPPVAEMVATTASMDPGSSVLATVRSGTAAAFAAGAHPLSPAAATSPVRADVTRLHSRYAPAPAPHCTSGTADDDIRQLARGRGVCWHEYGWGPAKGSILRTLRAPRLAAAGRPRLPPPPVHPVPVTLRIVLDQALPATARRLVWTGETSPEDAERIRHAAALAADVPPPEVSVEYGCALHSKTAALTFTARHSAAARTLASALLADGALLERYGVRGRVTAVVAEPARPQRSSSPVPVPTSAALLRSDWDNSRFTASWPVVASRNPPPPPPDVRRPKRRSDSEKPSGQVAFFK